jgi:hypothetical protein
MCPRGQIRPPPRHQQTHLVNPYPGTAKADAAAPNRAAASTGPPPEAGEQARARAGAAPPPDPKPAARRKISTSFQPGAFLTERHDIPTNGDYA